MTILVVDDELASLKAITESLNAEGHRLVTYDNPDRAKEYIRSKRPLDFQLAILDKMIRPAPPGVLEEDEFPEPEAYLRSGIEILHMVRQQDARVPIIFLSGFLEQDDRRELLDLDN